jgi:hypothetical protein
VVVQCITLVNNSPSAVKAKLSVRPSAFQDAVARASVDSIEPLFLFEKVILVDSPSSANLTSIDTMGSGFWSSIGTILAEYDDLMAASEWTTTFKDSRGTFFASLRANSLGVVDIGVTSEGAAHCIQE